MDNSNALLDNTIAYIKEIFANDNTGHDWAHTERVYKMAMLLSKGKQLNIAIVQLAALLHDIDDWKLTDNKLNEPVNAKQWLISQELDNESIHQVCSIIKALSFKGAGVLTSMNSLEGKIVQDADRLDAIGAIGIARAFAYGGAKNRQMHNAEIKPMIHESFDSYKSSQGTTINHFYEKLLLLKDLMNTEEAKQIAEQRHQYMLNFLEQFYSEWNVIIF
jgi:uncharacterized protein